MLYVMFWAHRIIHINSSKHQLYTVYNVKFRATVVWNNIFRNLLKVLYFSWDEVTLNMFWETSWFLKIHPSPPFHPICFKFWLSLHCLLDWGRSSPRGLLLCLASSSLRTSSSTSSRKRTGGTACLEAPMSTTGPTAWLLIHKTH